MKRVDAGIENVKRSDTAELRRRFDAITGLLAAGYNHKQICEHLNTQGLAIPYPQYRAIISRLRREKAPPNVEESERIQPSRLANVVPAPMLDDVSTNRHDDVGVPDTQSKKISWNPLSEVKWK